ncbi:conjugative transposon protein TraK [Chitinophaga pendula]|uniref:conjugative transposon protein TraK n=1 Tax=Chitinophaga TaxID=79328 RepID=UPI000BAF6B96|nr:MULTISPECIES: conjugative transposon protein TraK [Chitinophaga]ASZ13719.1 conjugative transposon protein TraK [Chitinophaga sp. MD30]UCJ08664.1 conjugative transposon protein TraK [Chitinophaga pendula]
MFKKMKSIQGAFAHVRLFTLVIVVLSFCLVAFTVYKSMLLAAKTQGRIYVLANGKAIEAFASEKKENIPVEIRDHVKMFHFYLFTLDPDETVIKKNIGKALYMADASAKRLYENLKESGYYNNIISGNISQKIEVDSVAINIDQYPYYFKCYAHQRLVRATSILTRSLITEGYVRNVSRSDNNPHGFLVERWSTLENKDLNTVER